MSIHYKLSALEGKVIAIDGPAGSGKSTTARLLAMKVGFIYLDTGAMYRAVTWFALENGLPLDNGKMLGLVAEKVNIRFEMDGEINLVFLNDEDVTESIRSPEVTQNVSDVSAHPEVRRVMVRRQKEMGKRGGIVAEGRDTTSVVFPDADIKVFLDASLEERATRRLLEMTHKGMNSKLDDQIKDLARRDKLDSNREFSPLKKTPDSIVVDTTNLTIDDQIESILKLIKLKVSHL
jgi:cytidylate kinase